MNSVLVWKWMNIARRVIGAAKIFTKGKLFHRIAHTYLAFIRQHQADWKQEKNKIESKVNCLQEMERARQYNMKHR